MSTFELEEINDVVFCVMAPFKPLEATMQENETGFPTSSLNDMLLFVEVTKAEAEWTDLSNIETT